MSLCQFHLANIYGFRWLLIINISKNFTDFETRINISQILQIVLEYSKHLNISQTNPFITQIDPYNPSTNSGHKDRPINENCIQERYIPLQSIYPFWDTAIFESYDWRILFSVHTLYSSFDSLLILL